MERSVPQLLNEALALRAAGRREEARICLQQLLALEPDHPEARQQLGNTLRSLGRHAEALPELERACSLSPSSAVCLLNLGVTLFELDRAARASECFRRALAIEPERPEAWNILGCALLSEGRIGEAKKALGEALRLRPDYASAHENLGRCLKAEGRVEEALVHLECAQSLQPSSAGGSNLLFALNYLPAISPDTLEARHRSWALLHADRLAPSAPPPRRALRGRRLKIGYVSPDFCRHAVSFFIAPVLAHHDRSRVEVFCYFNGLTPDPVTARLRSLAEHWREVAMLDDAQLAELVRKDGIDVLVDLAGHTARNRLLVFARRPAPLQLTWLGYPSGTGLSTIDLRLSDERCLPTAIDSPRDAERILRLPEVFCCYEPPAQAPAVAPPPPLEDRGPVFCSFSNLAKLSTPCLRLWASLLQRLPGASLLLKSPGADDADASEWVYSHMRAAGIPESRIRMHGASLPVKEHLELYAGCHVALDPFPYNGTTTTCEALWMGIPVVTLAGDSHASRVGVSLLGTLGLSELVASSEDAYLQTAASLALDLSRLTSLRSSLRERMRNSPLCQAAPFTRNLEETLFKAYVNAD